MLEDPAVRLSLGVVELVDDDVVKLVASELLEVIGTGQGLYGCEDHVGFTIPLLAHVKAKSRGWADSAKRPQGLLQDLLAMRDEQDAAELDRVYCRRR